ncbi:MAG TPA: DUF805 domain-containing protein [Allosphingosinicella sp.]|nr:DUF805 domain-containing protein [Allosphingosinicella sp.]
MRNILNSIGHGFAGLLRFGGRDARLSFWPYAAFIVFLTQIGMMSAMLPMIARVQRYVLAHPEQAEVVSGPGHYSLEMKGYAPDLGPVMAEIAWASLFVSAAAVALLAAAVARRLHDRDRRGWWGLLPVPFLAFGLALMPGIFAGFDPRSGTLDPWPFLALILNNLVYFGMLGVLIVLLAGPGTPGPNRFGPPPA